MNGKDPKKVELYLKQKELLLQFLHTGAISQAQFDKSFGCLTEKMGMEEFSGIQDSDTQTEDKQK